MIKPFKPYCAEQPWLPFSEVLMDWDEDFHQLMLCDQIRMQAYEQAIRQAVRPGDRVVDLGTGTGILAQWALQAGASTVYGIDMDSDILAHATRRIADEGFGDRFVPINQLSYDVRMPEKADVLISEIIGNIGDNEDFQPILEDAIARFLKPGGVAIPDSVETFIVPVSSEQSNRCIALGEIRTLNKRYQLADLMQEQCVQDPFNLYYDNIIPERQHLSSCARVQYYHDRWDQSPEYERLLKFTAHSEGVLTGFKGFFQARLFGDIILDISSGEISPSDFASRKCSDSWKHCYFPIEQAIPVCKGDEISLTFRRSYPMTRDGSGFRQFYSWSGTVNRNHFPVGEFNQGMQPDRLKAG